MSKVINAGVIGLGVGEKHIEGYNHHPHCRVVSICDFDEDKLKEVGQRYPEIKRTSKAMDILQDPQIHVVSIASYDNYHYEQIVEGLKHQKHLFVEKPLVLFDHEARHIRGLLNENPHLKLSSNLILRKSPRFIELRDKILAKELGTLFYVEGDYNYGRIHKLTEGWRGKIDFYSIVNGGGVHILDLLMWLTDDEIEEVCALGNRISTQNSQFRYDDMVVTLLRFKSGMTGKMACNFGCIYPHFHKLTLYGTNATFENGLPHAKWYTTRDPQVAPVDITTPYPGTHKGDLLHSFIEGVLKDQPPEVTKEDIFKAMSVCYSVEKALKEKSFVKVDYL
ncbi:Gfo/Idh/MocA family oxidoreductase [Deltaproteobacteria bacterium TL4]